MIDWLGSDAWLGYLATQGWFSTFLQTGAALGLLQTAVLLALHRHWVFEQHRV